MLERVRGIPEGFVATYGDVSPGAPRFAGAVLFGAGEPELPWWRVVRADGSLAKGDRQRRLLLAEGVPFRGARVDVAVDGYRARKYCEATTAPAYRSHSSRGVMRKIETTSAFSASGWTT